MSPVYRSPPSSAARRGVSKGIDASHCRALTRAHALMDRLLWENIGTLKHWNWSKHWGAWVERGAHPLPWWSKFPQRRSTCAGTWRVSMRGGAPAGWRGRGEHAQSEEEGRGTREARPTALSRPSPSLANGELPPNFCSRATRTSPSACNVAAASCSCGETPSVGFPRDMSWRFQSTTAALSSYRDLSGRGKVSKDGPEKSKRIAPSAAGPWRPARRRPGRSRRCRPA